MKLVRSLNNVWCLLWQCLYKYDARMRWIMTIDAFEEPFVFVSRGEPRRPKYPWEDSNCLELRRICDYLVEIFDASRKFVRGNNSGYDFKINEKTYSVRFHCLSKTDRSWTFKFGRSKAEHILFFGFRDPAKPILEFCLDLPREKFRDRKGITIQDDGYHLKGYSEFWIDQDNLQKMRDLMSAIENQDESKVEELLPTTYKCQLDCDWWGLSEHNQSTTRIYYILYIIFFFSSFYL